MIHPFIVLYGNSEPDKASNKHLLIIVVIQQLWPSLVAQMVKNLPAMWEIPFDSWVGKISWRRDRLQTPVFMGFPGGSDSKESTHNVGDVGSVPGLGQSPGEGKGYPLQYSGLENSMDSIVYGVAKSQTRLSSFHLHFVTSSSLTRD